MAKRDTIAKDQVTADRKRLAMYKAFMTSYVKRINEATFNVTINGVRIGSAKYSRLACINTRTRIITFSRYAVENVPERGRRYLVLHELAHVKEIYHNRRFWDFVAFWEPDYKRVDREIGRAFIKNVREEQATARQGRVSSGPPRLFDVSHRHGQLVTAHGIAGSDGAGGSLLLQPEFDENDEFDWEEGGFWEGSAFGTISGGMAAPAHENSEADEEVNKEENEEENEEENTEENKEEDVQESCT